MFQVTLFHVEFVISYVSIVCKFPDDLIRNTSKYKEYDARLRILLKEIETHVYSTPIDPKSIQETTRRLQAIEELNAEKLKCTLEFNKFISDKLAEFKKFNETNKRAEYASSTDSATENNHEDFIVTSTPLPKSDPAPINKRKRGRKPKRVLVEIKLDDLNKADLMMLAEAAEHKDDKIQPEAHTSSFLKVPVTKRAGKRKRRTTKKDKRKDEVEDDMTSGPESTKETPDDEPTYCLCNKVSFGDMVMCENEACSIEWFHFPCVQLKRAPKGKW